MFTVHSSPDQAVRAKIDYLSRVRKKDGEATYRKLLQQTIISDPWFTARVVLGWNWLDEELHGKTLLGFYARHAGKDTAVFIPRGHGKTLIRALLTVTRMLANPSGAFLFASATEDHADNFGQMIGKILMENEILQRTFPDVVPKSPQDVERWGKDGYTLPNRRPRVDPTLTCLSLRGNPTGKHPDEVDLDDLIVLANNNEAGWQRAETFIKECKMLLPANGIISVTGTRWDDKDPYSKIINGRIRGKQGKFETLVMSCYEDDNTAKEPIYPKRKRWNMETETGYSKAQLDEMRLPEAEGGLGAFFDAQMRNDPAPIERQDIRVSDIQIYEKDQTPILSHVRSFGIETTGGGKLIFNLLLEKTEKQKIFIPLQETAQTRSKRGETKFDKIKATLEPIVSSGRCYAQKWMLGDGSETGTLGYEIRRLGKAAHDDIVDCLHTIIAHQVCGSYPNDARYADLYLGADLAYSEEKRADFTVLMAVAVDHKQNYYVIDYERFQLSSPTGIVDRITDFYFKWKPDDGETFTGRRSFSFAKTYK